jgi:hypothetical protein
MGMAFELQGEAEDAERAAGFVTDEVWAMLKEASNLRRVARAVIAIRLPKIGYLTLESGSALRDG